MMKTDQELRKIAMDFVEGKIFTDRQISSEDMIPTVFMPLGLMDEEQMADLISAKPRLIYEYLDSIGPMGMGINGHPIFFSARFLNEEETAVWSISAELRRTIRRACLRSTTYRRDPSRPLRGWPMPLRTPCGTAVRSALSSTRWWASTGTSVAGAEGRWAR